jgi:hypothetical protein
MVTVMVMEFLQAVRVVSQNPRGGMLALGRLAAGERSWLESSEWRRRPLLKILPIIEDWEGTGEKGCYHGLFEENNNYYYLSSVKNRNNAAVFGIGVRTYSCSQKKVEHRRSSSLVVILGVIVYLRTLLTSFYPPAVYISTTLQCCSGTLRCTSCR